MTARPRTVIAVNGQTIAGAENVPASFETELVVNGEVIDKRKIADETQNHASPKNKPAIAWRKAAALSAPAKRFIALCRDAFPQNEY